MAKSNSTTRVHHARTDLDNRMSHLKKRDELAALLRHERFKVLSPYLNAPEHLNWVARNALATKTTLGTPYFPVNDTAQLRKAMDDFQFHFRNFSASIVATLAALFVWSRESDIPEIDSRAVQLKRTAHLQVMNCLRSRLMHGARVFGSFGSRLNLGEPTRGYFQYTIRLVEPALVSLRDLPHSTKHLVESIESAIRDEIDWVTPFVNGVLSDMEGAWNDAEKAFREKFSEVVREREQIMIEIAFHEHVLEREGFFDPIDSRKKQK